MVHPHPRDHPYRAIPGIIGKIGQAARNPDPPKMEVFRQVGRSQSNVVEYPWELIKHSTRGGMLTGLSDESGLPTFRDFRGDLTVAEGAALPFPIRRLYWIDNLPAGVWRGAHAHCNLSQLVFALRGSFHFIFRNGLGVQRQVEVTRGDLPIIIEPGWWRDFRALEKDSMLLVAASDEYDPDECIRDWSLFQDWARSRKGFH